MLYLKYVKTTSVDLQVVSKKNAMEHLLDWSLYHDRVQVLSNSLLQ